MIYHPPPPCNKVIYCHNPSPLQGFMRWEESPTILVSPPHRNVFPHLSRKKFHAQSTFNIFWIPFQTKFVVSDPEVKGGNYLHHVKR